MLSDFYVSTKTWEFSKLQRLEWKTAEVDFIGDKRYTEVSSISFHSLPQVCMSYGHSLTFVFSSKRKKAGRIFSPPKKAHGKGKISAFV